MRKAPAAYALSFYVPIRPSLPSIAELVVKAGVETKQRISLEPMLCDGLSPGSALGCCLK